MNSNSWIDYSTQFSNPKVKAIFSYKSFLSDGEEGRINLSKDANFDSSDMVIPNQTHSTHIQWVSKPSHLENTDGIFTGRSNLICSIQVADCMPIYFAHESKLVVGIVHVGWRGLVDGILENCAVSLNREGLQVNEFDILIGPSIQSCCFEVKNDIVDLFDSNFILQKDDNSYLVNLQEIAKGRLIKSGFSESKISISNECTFCNDLKYHSYRRDGQSVGRMIGLIAIQ